MSTVAPLNKLVKQILSYRDEKSLRSFLRALFTPKELEEIPTRLEIIKLLKSGVAQRDIAEKLGVGIATVTRGSKELHKGNFTEIT